MDPAELKDGTILEQFVLALHERLDRVTVDLSTAQGQLAAQEASRAAEREDMQSLLRRLCSATIRLDDVETVVYVSKLSAISKFAFVSVEVPDT